MLSSLEEDVKFKTSLFEFAPQLNSKTISTNKKPPLWAEIFGILCGLLAAYYIFKLFF